MGTGVFKTPTLGGRRFHWIGDWCVQHTNPWWQEVPLNWGLVCSTHQPLVAGGSTEMGGGVFNTPTLGGIHQRSDPNPNEVKKRRGYEASRFVPGSIEAQSQGRRHPLARPPEKHVDRASDRINPC